MARMMMFQNRVYEWALKCFGEKDSNDRSMRTVRFLEEALELAQACGCDRSAAEQVLDYVYNRPTGDVAQEVGGTMVSLAVLCEAFELDMRGCGEVEYERIVRLIDQIRERHAKKPSFHSPTGGSSG